MAVFMLETDELRRNCVRAFNTSSINADEFEDELTSARMTIGEKCYTKYCNFKVEERRL